MMKVLTYCCFLLFIGLFACNSPNTESNVAETHDELIADQLAENRIEVLDFYGTHRCVTCRAIEANSRKALLKLYPEELKTGVISFHTIDVDNDANYELAKKFEATGTALFLNVVQGSTETHVDLTTQAFDKGTDSLAMEEELKFYIDLQLKELRKNS